MFNFITLLGWSPEGEQEIFTRDELIQVFNASRLSKSPAVFDTNKLSWMNNEYLKKTELPRLVDLCVPHLQKRADCQRLWMRMLKYGHRDLVALYQDKLRYAAEIVPLTELFFLADVTDEEEAKTILAEEQVPVVLRAFCRIKRWNSTIRCG